MGGAGDDPQIVNVGYAVDLCSDFTGQLHHFFDNRVVGSDRVQVSGNFDMQLFSHLSFYIVDHIVALHHIGLRVDFDVDGCENSAGAVVVHYQIVYAQDAVIGQSHIADGVHQFRIRRLTQQRAHSLFDQADAGPDDEERYQAAHVAVDLQPGQFADDDADQNHGGGDYVVSAVCTSGCQSKGINSLADINIEQRLPNFDGDCKQQYDDNGPAEFQRGRMHNLVCRRLDQFNTHDHDEDRNDHT